MARQSKKNGQRETGKKKSFARLRRFCLCCLTLCLALPGAAARSQPSIRWTTDPANANRMVVEVSGLSEASLRRLRQPGRQLSQWQRLLSVYAEQRGATPSQGSLPMLGVYRVQSSALRFEPQFPLEPGVVYRAVFRPDQLPARGGSRGDPITAIFQLPPRDSAPTTTVSRVYPSAETLPENLLKFYLHFSAPMSRGRVYDHLRLREDAGQEIELPFLEIDEELWDAAMTRLTLFIDPGRIKRGVLPLEEIGPSLEAGKSYTLVISREWKDGVGRPLKDDYRKVFKVGPPDRQPPDPAHWKIQPPPPDARQPLAVIFPEPMDHALASRVINVTTEAGDLLKGEVALADEERRWTFAPDRPWRRGRYQLVVQTTIEDLAGNNIGKPFEVDLFEDVQRRLTASTIKLSFEIR